MSGLHSLQHFSRKYANSILLSVVIICTPNVYAQTAKQLVRIITTEHPPLVGTHNTILSDIVLAAFHSQNIQIEYVTYPIARISWAMDKEKSSIAQGGFDWFQNSQQNQELIFIPIYYTTMNLFSLKKHFPTGVHFDSLSDLKRYRIGYVLGGVLSPMLSKAEITPYFVSSFQQTAQLLTRERVDMFVAPAVVGWQAIGELHDQDRSAFTISEQALKTASGDLILHKHQKELANTFKEGLKIIIDNGHYLEIIKKYHGSIALPPPTKKLIHQYQNTQ